MNISDTLILSGSPHIHTSRTTRNIMWSVVAALLPALLVGFYIFGLKAVAATAVCVISCLLTEWVVTRWMLGRKELPTDGSAMVTGLLLAMSLPSELPLWVSAIGGVAAIGLGKMAFGGLGCNVFNPAMVGRVFLLISFPAQMTTWLVPSGDGVTGSTISADVLAAHPDGVTGSTLLSHLKFGTLTGDNVDLMSMALGERAGSLGEVAALALLAGFLFLLCRRIVTWHAPVSVIVVTALLAWACGSNPVVEILSGGLLLGAFFMATDYVTSPMSRGGMLIFGAGIAVITFVIRHWGAYPEGVSFAILIMNGFVPLINRCIKPKKFGEGRVVK